MKLMTQSFEPGRPIGAEFALGIFDEKTHISFSDNKNPQLAWEEVPDGTQSFVVLCYDRDVPSKGDDVNQEGKTVPEDLPRVDFFHWILIDMPHDMRAIEAGQYSEGVVAKGKNGPEIKDGMRHGLNDYTGWFAGDESMAGQYFGYDGPCPPWNDSIIHHYHFVLYALDIKNLPVKGDFTGQQVRDAMASHILAEAELVGTYTINPDATLKD